MGGMEKKAGGSTIERKEEEGIKHSMKRKKGEKMGMSRPVIRESTHISLRASNAHNPTLSPPYFD